MVEDELNEHLGNEKHNPQGHYNDNYRNCHKKIKVKTESVGDMIIKIPCDSKSSFEPQLNLKHERISDMI